jgi:site-specific DNA recombinase
MGFAFSACSRRIDMPVESRVRQLQSVPASRAAVRCAIYTRKSTDEGLDQAFNTLDAQREASESFIHSQRHEGWAALPQKYDDGGYTGANMDRPALKRLLADVESGAVNCVVVYKVDRLTRSLLDFARIMEVLDKHGATFVSVTQQFNTTSSLGRLTLNILLSFAQFEREMISERTRDKMGAARRKGKWVGGNLVLGYDVAAQGGVLVVNEEEAKRVREIFRLYLEYGSLIPVIQELDRRGWRLKAWTTREGREVGGSPFTKNKLYNLLTNVIYTGKVGYGGQIYAGEHPRIVDDEVFNRAQETLHRNGRRGGRNVRNKYSALLKGIVRCATCDAGMIHTYTKKQNRLYRYYVCVKAHQRGWNKCRTRAVAAQALESAVVAQLRGIGRNPAMLGEVMRQIAEQQRQRVAELEREKAAIEQEMEKTTLEMGELAAVAGSTGAAAKSAADRLAELHERTDSQERRLAELHREIAEASDHRVDANDLDQTLKNFDLLWEQMTTWEQEKFIRALVEQVRYDGTTGTVTVGFRSSGVRSLCEYGTAQQH